VTQAGYSHDGKQMIFRLGDEQLGIDILRVRELMGMLDITRSPLHTTASKASSTCAARGSPCWT
jgi:hypothetical protein